MTITNILLIFVVLVAAGALMYNYIKKKKEAPVEDKITVDDKTYTLDLMEEFVKRRLDEITKVNLYDIGLSEEELKRRKNKKYELKKAINSELDSIRFYRLGNSYKNKIDTFGKKKSIEVGEPLLL